MQDEANILSYNYQMKINIMFGYKSLIIKMTQPVVIGVKLLNC